MIDKGVTQYHEDEKALIASHENVSETKPRCFFCGMPEGYDKSVARDRGPLSNPPGFLPHVLMHADCVKETRRGGLD